MWDFSHIFPTREAFEKEFSDCSKEIDAIGNIRGHLGESPEALAEALNAIYGVFERFDRCTKKRIIPTPKIRSSKHVLPGFM